MAREKCVSSRFTAASTLGMSSPPSPPRLPDTRATSLPQFPRPAAQGFQPKRRQRSELAMSPFPSLGRRPRTGTECPSPSPPPLGFRFMSIPAALSRAPPCARLRGARMGKSEASTPAKREGGAQTSTRKDAKSPGPWALGHPQRRPCLSVFQAGTLSLSFCSGHRTRTL